MHTPHEKRLFKMPVLSSRLGYPIDLDARYRQLTVEGLVLQQRNTACTTKRMYQEDTNLYGQAVDKSLLFIVQQLAACAQRTSRFGRFCLLDISVSCIVRKPWNDFEACMISGLGIWPAHAERWPKKAPQIIALHVNPR